MVSTTIYICPMHLEIRQIGPGSCPICGMALEPEVSKKETPSNLEYLDMRRRFWVTFLLTVPVFILAMSAHQLQSGRLAFVSVWIQLVLATPVVLWGGWPFFQRAWQSIKTRHLNMFTLVAMGTGTDVAIESAGITLLHGDLNGIVKALRLSKATMGNIRQNLFFAFIYNVLSVPLAAGILYPCTGLLLSPMIAAAAMSLSSVSVIINALRLRRMSF